MSFVGQYKDVIEVGDLAIFYGSPENVEAFHIQAGGFVNNRLGRFLHDDLIGLSFGCRWKSRDGKCVVHALHPTTDLWTAALSHRTQIIYVPDASYIIQALHLKPGSHVIECGTGSGSLSHHLIKTVAPTGHLYTFEYHAQRAELAQKEFDLHHLSPYVTLKCRDVCQYGFDLVDLADAGELLFHPIDNIISRPPCVVFLDLPAPWKVIEFAKQTLSKGKLTRICCFSPCIEQVQRNCSALAAAGFSDITMVELLSKNFAVKSFPLKMSLPFSERISQIDHVKLPDASISSELSDKNFASITHSTSHSQPIQQVPLISRAATEIKGHTSYLTFASYIY